MAREYLVFRLWGPLASWGGVAVGEVRGSAMVPTRSALLGFLAGALGLDRSDDDAHAELGRILRFAIAVERAGVPLTDYHTAQVAPPRRGRRDRTRADELRGPRHTLRTILSRREYRCDPLYRVAVWQEEGRGGAPRWRLAELEQALNWPVFVPYMGRKACTLGLPAGARTIVAESLPEALAAPDPPAIAEFLRRLRWGTDLRSGAVRLYWEGEPELGGLTAETETVRRDEPASRVRWTFGTRQECSAVWQAPTEEEARDVPE